MTKNEHICTHHSSGCHANSSYKRTIRNNSKLNHWRARNDSIQMNEVLNQNDFEKPSFECSCECIDLCPPKVTRTAGGIRWRGKKKNPLPSSRYHKKCISDQTLHTKIQPTNLPRNHITSAHCAECVKDRKKGKFKNQCYCFSPPNKPLLPVKPCVTQPNSKRVIKSGFKTGEGEKPKGYNLQTLKKAKNLLNYVPESEFLRKLLDEASKTFDCQCAKCITKCKMANMQFTKRRQLLEDAYDEVIDATVQSLDDLATMNHRCKLKCCKNNCKTSTSPHSSLSPQYSPRTSRHFTNLSPGDSPRSPQPYDSEFSPKTSKISRSPQRYDSEISPKSSPKISRKSPQRQNSGIAPKTYQRPDFGFSNNAYVTDCDKICAVKRIRDENYFDTHSTSFNLSPQNIPPHKCVHRFGLDDRLLPIPLHADAYGVSRCSKCNKRMAYATEEQIDAVEQVQKVVDYTQEKSAVDMLQNMPQMESLKNMSRKIRERNAEPMMQNMLQKESSKNFNRKNTLRSAEAMQQNMPQKESSKNFSRNIGKRSAVDILKNMPQRESYKNSSKKIYESSAGSILQNMSHNIYSKNFGRSGVDMLENMSQKESFKTVSKKIYERNAVLAMMQNMPQKESSKKFSRNMNKQNMPQKESSKDFSKNINKLDNVQNMPQKESKNFSRKINIPSRNEIVELNVPPPPLLLSKICQLKPTVPENTWALRYQKGVV